MEVNVCDFTAQNVFPMDFVTKDQLCECVGRMQGGSPRMYLSADLLKERNTVLPLYCLTDTRFC